MRLWLRMESLCTLVLLVLVYVHSGGSWGLFWGCFFVPDVSLVAFVLGPKFGSVLYNMAHALGGPALLMALALLWPGHDRLLTVGLIWMCHIHMDRALGYGLKQASSFHDTHLGTIGGKKSGG